MRVQKKISVSGEWAKVGVDFDEGDILEILSEGEITTGEYGDRHTFKIETRNGERNLSFNQTSLNQLIDAWGDDTATWKGKKAKAWILDMNVSGKIRAVVFLTAPNWIKRRVDGEVKFVPPTPEESAEPRHARPATRGTKVEEDTIEYPGDEGAVEYPKNDLGPSKF